jgi:hypothetical protein
MFFVTVYVACRPVRQPFMPKSTTYVPQSGTMNLATYSMGYDGIAGVRRLSGLSLLNSGLERCRGRPLDVNRKRTLYCLLTNPTSLRWMNRGGVGGEGGGGGAETCVCGEPISPNSLGSFLPHLIPQEQDGK